jgi:hypothetical protein
VSLRRFGGLVDRTFEVFISHGHHDGARVRYWEAAAMLAAACT